MTKKTIKKSIFTRIRNNFIAGIVALIPIGITLYLTIFIIKVSTGLIPNEINPNHYLPFDIPGTGLVVAIFSLIIIGFFTAGIFGRFFVNVGENLINKLPIIRSIYNALKQIFQTILGSSSKAFREQTR